MKRQLLALFTALCLLAGSFAVPAKAMLVCRMTGQAMEPVPEERAHGSCCGAKLTASTGGSLRYELSNPGCCELRQSPERREPPALKATVPDVLPVAALNEAPWLIAPRLANVVPLVSITDEVAPRGPPLLSASPRGPPVLS